MYKTSSRSSRFNDTLTEQMKQFVLENISKESKNRKESEKLEKEFIKKQGCCGTVSPELEHWNQLRVLIMTRETNTYEPCCLLPYDMKRYFQHGIPSIVIPSLWAFSVQLIHVSLFAVASLLQILQAQKDGTLNATSQWILIAGSFFGAFLFAITQNTLLMLPQLGNIVYCGLVLWGIYCNENEDLQCIF